MRTQTICTRFASISRFNPASCQLLHSLRGKLMLNSEALQSVFDNPSCLHLLNRRLSQARRQWWQAFFNQNSTCCIHHPQYQKFFSQHGRTERGKIGVVALQTRISLIIVKRQKKSRESNRREGTQVLHKPGLLWSEVEKSWGDNPVTAPYCHSIMMVATTTWFKIFLFIVNNLHLIQFLLLFQWISVNS